MLMYAKCLLLYSLPVRADASNTAVARRPARVCGGARWVQCESVFYVLSKTLELTVVPQLKTRIIYTNNHETSNISMY
jgi:hypothetical protein